MNAKKQNERTDRWTERQTKVEADTLFFNVSYKRNAELVLSLFVVVVVVALSWTHGR